MDPTAVPAPVISGESDGNYYAYCPACDVKTAVVVTSVPFIDGAGNQRGETSTFDLAVYTAHYESAHL